ncbi:hypothetical protein SPRG_19649 [Saprolegnia parasitica CBS 223.65]|uniref:Uncharacterized protein n=1 Tax=Saprolegnia parasitica (strain CBS 223.65) TaxID=695850 RepID=A0A067CVC7_SAPPC|nr:hypothetical protein SPRG_19649 [Saprolegnia parasitica CBS 223.65]KDO30491.1 hypothetical protein SPRG_19649 [Saprolegnia parasitica CBS 223.65]|eukprot:XP_012198876.1 hypothetical protein SPRG_19649 [Saprolegnia parasitica CBS 223.65]
MLHRPFTPQKVRMHPFPHEIDHVVRPRSPPKSPMVKMPTATDSFPKSASCSSLPRARVAIDKHLPRITSSALREGNANKDAVDRRSTSRGSVVTYQTANESVLDEMRAFVEMKRRERKSATTATDVDVAKNGVQRKVTRGIELHMQCHLEFNHLHNRATRHLNVHPDPTTNFGAALETPPGRSSPFKVQQKDTSEGRKKKRESLSYQKLLRKLSPTITNSATTYINLLHLLQACRVCGGRVTFCNTCQTHANEYFHTFSPAELEKTYGKQLSPPDSTKVAEYSAYLRAREAATVRKGESKQLEDRN